MIRQYPPYGIQGERRGHAPALRDVIAALWECHGVQLFVFVLVAMAAFLVGLVTGSNCEAVRQSMLSS